MTTRWFTLARVFLVGLLLLGLAFPFVSMVKAGTTAESLQVMHHFGGLERAIAASGHYVYVGVGPRMLILDASNPARPTQVGQTPVLPDLVEAIAVAGDYAYLAVGEAGLRIIDVSDPAEPREVGAAADVGIAVDIRVADDYAYLAAGKLEIVDISDPLAPALVADFELEYADALTLDVADNRAYVGTDRGFWVIDVSEPSAPETLSRASLRHYPTGVAARGAYVYVTLRSLGLQVIDVSNPEELVLPRRLGTVWAADIVIADGYAYVADREGGLRILDLSVPADPHRVVIAPGYAGQVAIAGNYAYILGNGLHVLDISRPAPPEEIAYYTGVENPAGLFVTDRYGYVADRETGMYILDLTDPANPVEIGRYQAPRPAENVFVAGNYAYLATGAGLRIIDVSDPTLPFEVNAVLGGARDVQVVGQHAYVAAGYSGLWIVDVSNPSAPVRINTHPMPDDAEAWTVHVADNYAFVAAGEAGLRIVDISDPLMLRAVGAFHPDGAVYGLAITAANGAEERYAYLAGSDGVLVVDVSDPAVPQQVDSYPLPGIAFDVHIADGRAYTAWQRCDDKCHGGTEILDIADPAAPAGVGAYLTVPDPQAVYVHAGYAYVSVWRRGVHIVDVSNLVRLELAGSYSLAGSSRAVHGAGDYVYAALDGTLHVMGPSGHTVPQQVSVYDPPWTFNQIFATDEYLYAANADGLHVVDTSDPYALSENSAYAFDVPLLWTSGLFVTGGRAYLLSVACMVRGAGHPRCASSTSPIRLHPSR